MPSCNTIKVNFISSTGTETVSVSIENAIIGGWTARDVAAMEEHIVELEELGISRPASMPVYYRVSTANICVDDAIQTVGNASSGEVEFVILKTGNSLWVGVGSDHTDRKAEAYSISVAKQLCSKPIASEFWPYEEVKGHWDQLIISSYIVCDGVREQYQRATLESLLTADELLKLYADEQNEDNFPDNTIIFGGTCAAIGGIRPADRFEFSLEDPILNRRIEYGYDVKTLPDFS